MSTAITTGRAGRLRLRRQLSAAERASELLDRKARILAGELDRLELVAKRTGAEWERCAGHAAVWLGRCAALDGQRGLAAAAPSAPAVVDVEHRGAMGVDYPVHVTVTPPDEPARPGSSALAYAVTAHREALEAAVHHAVATRAVAVLDAELAATRTRQRAIDNRLVPRLEGALRTLEVQLDELDREENVRVRWASTQLKDGGGM
jgi:vacuolar-type H+-ATPase subunit D/Vma8